MGVEFLPPLDPYYLWMLGDLAMGSQELVSWSVPNWLQHSGD